MGVADLSTLEAAARAAIVEGDHSSALSSLREISIVLASMPDTVHGRMGTTWDRAAVATLIEQEEKAVRSAAVASGVRRTKVKYVNTSS